MVHNPLWASVPVVLSSKVVLLEGFEKLELNQCVRQDLISHFFLQQTFSYNRGRTVTLIKEVVNLFNQRGHQNTEVVNVCVCHGFYYNGQKLNSLGCMAY